MIHNIANIDGDLEPYDDEDYSDFDEEEFHKQKEVNCFACNGTGESHNPDYACSWCGGSGVIKRKY